jgi:hypothetical protein
MAKNPNPNYMTKSTKNTKAQKFANPRYVKAMFQNVLWEQEEFDLVENEHMRFLDWELDNQVTEERRERFELFGQ